MNYEKDTNPAAMNIIYSGQRENSINNATMHVNDVINGKITCGGEKGGNIPDGTEHADPLVHSITLISLYT